MCNAIFMVLLADLRKICKYPVTLTISCFGIVRDQDLSFVIGYHYVINISVGRNSCTPYLGIVMFKTRF